MNDFDFAAVDWGQAFWTIAAAALSSVSCALLGCSLVLRRPSLLGDLLHPAILPRPSVAFSFGSTRSA